MSYKINAQSSNPSFDIKIGEDLKYVGMQVVNLSSGEKKQEVLRSNTEACVVLIAGYINASINNYQYNNIGNRMSPFFEEGAFALYVSPGDNYAIEAITDSEIAICYGSAKGMYPSRLLYPKKNQIEHRGNDSTRRIAKNILSETDYAESLLIVEVITPGGSWSSFPSHRHDEDRLPYCSLLDEIYYHKLNPKEGGFALQRIYNDARTIDDVYSIENNTAVLVSEGYHPVSVVPGYDLYYLNVMAGPIRTWRIHNDPFFEHLI